jgi:hypothetical protein
MPNARYALSSPGNSLRATRAMRIKMKMEQRASNSKEMRAGQFPNAADAKEEEAGKKTQYFCVNVYQVICNDPGTPKRHPMPDGSVKTTMQNVKKVKNLKPGDLQTPIWRYLHQKYVLESDLDFDAEKQNFCCSQFRLFSGGVSDLHPLRPPASAIIGLDTTVLRRRGQLFLLADGEELRTWLTP